MIYADYSSTSIHKPQEVIDAMLAVLRGDFGNPSRGAHDMAHNALRLLDESREKIARYFGIKEYWNLGFTPNSSYALNLAIKGSIAKEDHVISSFWEHNSVLRPLYQTGCSIDFLPPNAEGIPDLALLPQLLRPHTKAIVINLMSNVTGNALDLNVIKDFAKKKNLLLILDASQYAGVFDLKIGEDFPPTLLAVTGHKSLYGPQGSGALIAHKVESLHPQNAGGTGVHSFAKEHPGTFPDVCEVGTLNLPAIAGLAAAVTHMEGIVDGSRRLQTIRRTFYQSLQAIDRVSIYGSPRGGASTLSVNIGTLPSQTVSEILNDTYHIATRSGAHCAPLLHEAFGTVEQGMLRFSFGLHTTDEEVAACVQAVREIAGKC